jgi:hypothetical protein
MKYARIVNAYAIDVRTDSPEGCYTENIVAEFVEVPDDVQDGWVLADGKWSTPVVYTPSAQEIADAQAAYKAMEDTEQAKSVRQTRDDKLKECDWRVIKALESNLPQDFAWATYRQNLRDITKQAGFPWEIIWPTIPE